MKSLMLYYWYVKTLQYGYMERCLEYTTFYVQKHIAPLTICSNPALVCDKPLGASTFVRLAYERCY